MTRFCRWLLLGLVTSCAAVARADDDPLGEIELAAQKAVEQVAPFVVKIETVGGSDVVATSSPSPGGRPAPGVRKGTGPTTGLIVSPQGHIITSSFNFANRPTDIFVTIPGKPNRFVAKQIATDTTRLLTLIKVEVNDLKMPTAFPKAEMQVGQWSLALGRTLAPDVNQLPSVSMGIISALGRLWGKGIQTDAKVSPTNYGGPLIAIDGRILGVLVPGSQRGEADITGVEWYDSGIGFAIPFEDVLAVVPRLQQGKDLRKGFLGITNQSTELYLAAVEVATVAPDSAAAKVGIQPGDRITAIDGRPIVNYSQVMRALGPKYEGDVVSVTVERAKKSITFSNVVLTGPLTATVQSWLGILPLRDDPAPGVPIRFVFPNSPADAAGLKIGERIMKATILAAQKSPAPTPARPIDFTQGSRQLSQVVAAVPVGTQMELVVAESSKDVTKTRKVLVKLAALTDVIVDKVPLPSSAERATIAANAGEKPDEKPETKPDVKPEDKPETPTGLQRAKSTLGRDYWYYIPENYKPSITHGVIIWLHPSMKGGKDADEMVKIWKPFLEDFHYILVGPSSTSPEGWVASESEAVTQVVNDAMRGLSIDRSRIIAHGMGIGGQMAFFLGFNARDLVRGVATTGAALASAPKDKVPNQPLTFFIVGGEKDPNIKEIAESVKPLQEKKYTVLYRPIPDFGKEYLTQDVLLELCRWIESLDKI